ncbi:MAG TPA: hypothetical protein PLC04_07935 [Candidatus Kapabacteria bacterium]|nr:hypothetical protein [Candidatus Kapabacteria bacterium]
MKTLKEIAEKYSQIEYNSDNYEVGGGLSRGKFASRRHLDATLDKGKLTLGQACQLFKKVTGGDLEHVKEVIRYAVPNMEWHHAGSFNGQMMKTYFLNSDEIADLAENWEKYARLFELQSQAAKEQENKRRELEEKRFDFLKEHAQFVERVKEVPPFFFEVKREMNGKYGWFDCSARQYNLPIYYTGWTFEKSEDYFNFLKIN